ncbi:Arp9p KNAG_0H00570 [Huiozyma naganishii CBS 8797]|uniref:Actin-like protein ARP9 n=1 Tax=Huiozyma naganishii (strain ATCC MYA-139 / BCRC 22969 / CBS 8797 / KCTC 17520 / NBRC 10181 / NCYC 3082 / Yp74L-3) TaxID=1071383 RepID=J7RP89_HUIN7|nr:hypothetical protein KNAG_0H00570 [Kazachstania naganishii CBS 8797]CCK71473.1 hypothetical protein KNAG_0H00570 [Kazachstania naganishii CBS 8797]
MAPFRLDSILIVYPESATTLVQFGLNDEAFTVPELEIPTRIYKEVGSDKKNKYFSEPTETSVEVSPIKDGLIADLPAFLQFLKLVYGSILAKQSVNNPSAFEFQLANIPLLLLTSHKWSQIQCERITQFVFEHLQMSSLFLLSSALATTYALVSQPNSIIIDIGTSYTDIVPVIDYTALAYIGSRLKMGGDRINQTLKKLLPHLSDEDIEILKKSHIFEVVNDDMKKFHKILDTAGEDGVEDEEEGSLNVVDLVTSGRDPREVLEERERMKNEKKKNVPNSEMETNSFWDSQGNEVTIGKQRFQGCDELIAKISERTGAVMNNIPDVAKAQIAWENIIITGATSSIQGFKEGLIAKLVKDHLVIEPEEEKNSREQAALEALPAYKRSKNKFMDTSVVPTLEYSQIPTVIKLSKYPEYFPNWKKHGYADISFLGAQIVAKQIFTHSRDVNYISKSKYDETGPSCLWDIAV